MKVYEAETGRSARLASEHLKDLEKKREKSVLYKHKISDQPTENVKFKMEITKKFKPMRQCAFTADLDTKHSIANPNLITPLLIEWLWRKRRNLA